jgi:hypothetical protein
VQGFGRFVVNGISPCERLRNGVAALLKNGAICPIKYPPVGLHALSAVNTNSDGQ